jgi:GNAT superfamily N-acetyltransferase
VTGFSIRRIRAGGDTGPAADLLVRFFAEEGFDTPAELIRQRTAQMAGIDACGLFIAESAGSAIGAATISLEFGIEFGWSAEMGDLYVMPAWRGNGVSRALLNAIEGLLAEVGASGYQVTVTPLGQAHHDLRSYYAKLGFGGEGRLILRKSL